MIEIPIQKSSPTAQEQAQYTFYSISPEINRTDPSHRGGVGAGHGPHTVHSTRSTAAPPRPCCPRRQGSGRHQAE